MSALHSHSQQSPETFTSLLLRISGVLCAIILGSLLAPAGMGLLGAILAAITVFIALQGIETNTRSRTRHRRLSY